MNKKQLKLSLNLRGGARKGSGRKISKDYRTGAFRNVVLQYKISARNRGFDYDISEDDFEKLTKQDCFYCGREPSNITRDTSGRVYIYNGLDRIDNEKGYTLDNVLPCCRPCNIAKMKRSYGEFIEWAVKIAKRHGNLE